MNSKKSVPFRSKPFRRLVFPLLLLLAIFFAGRISAENSQSNLPEQVMKQTGEWCSKTCSQPHNDIWKHIDKAEFQAIVDLGLPAVPYLMDMVQGGSSFDRACLCTAVRKITKVSFPKMARDKDKSPLPRYRSYMIWWKIAREINLVTFENLYKQWSELPREEKYQKPFTAGWQAIHRGNPDAYERAYQEWKSLPDGNQKEIDEPFQRSLYQQMLDLGIDVLPLAIEKAGQGDKDLIEAIDYWTGGALKKELSNTAMPEGQECSFCLVWWKDNKERFLLPAESPSRERITRNAPMQVTCNSHSYAILDSTSEWLCSDMDYDDNDIIDTAEYDYFMERHAFTPCSFDDPGRVVTAMKAPEPLSPTGFRVTHSARAWKEPSKRKKLLESKLGMGFRISHPVKSLESEIYGKIWRHYKRK